MTVIVTINDIELDDSLDFVFFDTDFNLIDSSWNTPDELLVGLSTFEAFKGRTQWSMLLTDHYRFLIHQNYLKLIDLSKQDRCNVNHPVVKSFNFLITGMIRCIEHSTNSKLKSLSIDFHNMKTITYSFRCEMYDRYQKLNRANVIHLVIDNIDKK